MRPMKKAQVPKPQQTSHAKPELRRKLFDLTSLVLPEESPASRTVINHTGTSTQKSGRHDLQSIKYGDKSCRIVPSLIYHPICTSKKTEN